MSTNSKLLFLLTAILFISCTHRDNEKARKLTSEASKIAYDYKLDSVKRRDSALALFDKAIANDSDYEGAYMGKSYILAERRDMPGLLEINWQLMRLFPNQPLWKIQRGFYLELSGKKQEAAEFYKTGLQQYKDMFKDNPDMEKDINLRIEYISALQLAVDDAAGKKEYDKLKANFPDNELVKFYPFIPKQEMVELWLHPEKAEKIMSVATPPGL